MLLEVNIQAFGRPEFRNESRLVLVLPPDIQEQAMQKARQDSKDLTSEFMHRLAVILLTAQNPKLDLVSLLYLSGFSMPEIIGCEENTMASIADKLGLSKQWFQDKCKRTAKLLNLDYEQCNRGPRRQKSKASQVKVTPSTIIQLAHRARHEISTKRMSPERARKIFDTVLGDNPGLN